MSQTVRRSAIRVAKGVTVFDVERTTTTIKYRRRVIQTSYFVELSVFLNLRESDLYHSADQAEKEGKWISADCLAYYERRFLSIKSATSCDCDRCR